MRSRSTTAVHYRLRRRQTRLSLADDPEPLPTHFVQPAVHQRKPLAAVVNLLVVKPRGYAVPVAQ